MIEYDNSSFTIAAVMKNPPQNSSIQFDIVQPLDIPYGINSRGYSPAVVFLKPQRVLTRKCWKEKFSRLFWQTQTTTF